MAFVPAANAQSLVDRQIDSLAQSTRMLNFADGRVTTSRPDAEAAKKIMTFYYDQYRNSQDPGAPYFLFMSKDDNLLMGIGGAVRMRGFYDWGNVMPNNAFAPYFIPMHGDALNNKVLGTTPAGVCLYFRLLGSNKIMGDYQAYVEANFSGSNNTFKLKKAYVMFRDFTVGYASSTFCDPAAVPPTIDSQGATNSLDHTAVLVRYMPRLADHVLGAVSVETPTNYISADGVKTDSRRSYIPDFAAMLQYDWGREASQHIRLGAVYRSLPYRDLLKGANYNVNGWGLQLSSVNHPIDPLTLYLTANYGKGYAGLTNDLQIGNADLIGDPDIPGRLYAPKAFGWCVGVQYNFRPNLFATVSASQVRILPEKQIEADQYKYGMLGTVNLMWNPIPRVQLGVEFNAGRRQNFSRIHANAYRAEVLAQLSF